jgi:hypothetical protein
MSKIISFAIVLLLSVSIKAQENSTEKEIKKVIDIFFEGLHNGDSTVMAKTLYKDIKIQTTFTNQKGEKVLVSETKNTLLTNVANKKIENIFEEKLLSYSIHVDGNLASVWTPYEFYLNGAFSHCGANSFQLFDNNGLWQITYLVDMRRRDNCKALKN